MSRARLQPLTLILLRTVIGWHFLYEGYYKLTLPGWSAAGVPLPVWSSAGYLRASSGPFAAVFEAIGPTAGPWIDTVVPIVLVVVGVSLMLGLFTQVGAWIGVVLLTLFYLAAIPTSGAPMPAAEGTYLIVNKTLVEWAALLAVAASHTGTIAGLDLVWRRSAETTGVVSTHTVPAAAGERSRSATLAP